MSGGEAYVTITGTMRARTKAAVRIEVEDSRPVWIPRSCINGVDDKLIDIVERDGTITLRIFEWIAEREGLV